MLHNSLNQTQKQTTVELVTSDKLLGKHLVQSVSVDDSKKLSPLNTTFYSDTVNSIDSTPTSSKLAEKLCVTIHKIDSESSDERAYYAVFDIDSKLSTDIKEKFIPIKYFGHSDKAQHLAQFSLTSDLMKLLRPIMIIAIHKNIIQMTGDITKNESGDLSANFKHENEIHKAKFMQKYSLGFQCCYFQKYLIQPSTNTQQSTIESKSSVQKPKLT